MHLYPVQDKTVVIVDILRATSCMTTAFAHGIESITPFASLDACMAMKEKHYVIAGERDGKKVSGFDLGNSPFEYMDAKAKRCKNRFYHHQWYAGNCQSRRCQRNHYWFFSKPFCRSRIFIEQKPIMCWLFAPDGKEK